MNWTYPYFRHFVSAMSSSPGDSQYEYTHVIDHAFLPDAVMPSWESLPRNIWTLVNGQNIQCEVCKSLLHERFCFDLEEYMSKRLSKWLDLVSLSAKRWWHLRGAYVLNLCIGDLQILPRYVLSACLQSALDFWSSARRSQQSQQGYSFGCGTGRDCLDHCLVCKRMEATWPTMFEAESGAFQSQLLVGYSKRETHISQVFPFY